jgi:N-sulfoglucosamine sulfohydrolase
MKETNDLGLVQPEARMVREKLFPPDGNQPATAAPSAKIDGGKLTVTCETDGASIGYRKPGEPSWKVYTAPVELPPGEYEVVAHRIGYERSVVIKTGVAR